MKLFGDRLRERAAVLALSHADVARRAGLSDKRYSNYVIGLREPDLATLVRIADALETTPDALLGATAAKPSTSRAQNVERLCLAASSLSDDDLELLIVQTEAFAGWRRRRNER